MRLVPLTLDYELTEFNCGDEQLNNFLYEDAKPSRQQAVSPGWDTLKLREIAVDHEI